MNTNVMSLVFILIVFLSVTDCSEVSMGNVDINTQTGALNIEGFSSCFVRSQNKLSSIRKTLLVSSMVDFGQLGQILHQLILDLQKSTIRKENDTFIMPLLC